MLLFSVVAVTPTIVVAIFATVFFQLGIQAWFNERVRTALDESMQVAQGYLTEHKDEIRTDAFAMADDMARAGPFLTSDVCQFRPVPGNPDFAARADGGGGLRTDDRAGRRLCRLHGRA